MERLKSIRRRAAWACVAVCAVLFWLPFTRPDAKTFGNTSFQKAGNPPPTALPDDPEDDANEIEARIQYYRRRHGDIDPEIRLKFAREEYRRLETEKARAAAHPTAGPSWVSIGPTNGSGRFTAIAPHPSVIGTVYAGSDGGGVWKTTDGGVSWTGLTDSINSLAVGSLAIAPSSPNVLYLGTGSDDIGGIGFLKSTDGGTTWAFPGSVLVARFYRISVHPTNSLDLVVATGNGTLRSTDGGATWAQGILPDVGVNDLVRHPGNPLVLYGSVSDCTGGVCRARVSKSTDGGSTWVDKSSGLPPASASLFISNMAIAISASNPLVMYGSMSIRDFSAGSTQSHIFKTVDGAESWADLPGMQMNFLASQAFHDNTIVVSPANSNIVLAGGVFYVQSNDGGISWGNPGFGGATVHADATDMRYQGTTLYIANDGGIWSSPDNGNSATGRNAGLITRQYYSMSNDEVNRNRVFAGGQDNGTDRRPDAGGTAWAPIVGGDGFDCPVNPAIPQIVYATVQNGSIFRSREGGTDVNFIVNHEVTPAFPKIEWGRGFFTIVVMDPINPFSLFTASYRLWRTTNGGDSWVPLPTTTTDGSTWNFTSIQAMAVAPGDSSRLLVAKFDGPQFVFRSINGGASWMRSATMLPFVNSLAIDPTNSNIAYSAGYPTGSTSTVYMTTDGGATWLPRGIGLPLLLVSQVVRIDPANSAILYCGTDAGVYRSTDQGLTWNSFGMGLPSVAVDDLRILQDGSVLRVATFGRGVWEMQIPTGNTAPQAAITIPSATLRVAKGTAVSFQGSVSDPDPGDPVSGLWSFSDTGTSVSTGGGASSISHTFTKAGEFRIGLTAEDNHRSRGASSVLIGVYEPFDSCSTPMTIPGNGPFPWSLDTDSQSAQVDATDPSLSCVGGSVFHTLWFEFTPTLGGNYTFAMNRLPFNYSLNISAWTGPPCGPHTQVPNGCGFDELTIPTQAGTTVRVMISGFAIETGRNITLTVTRGNACVPTLSRSTQFMTAGGGSGTVDVKAAPPCEWIATSNNPSFLSFLSSATGTGSNPLLYFVAPNPGTNPRTGTFTIAGQTLTVTQAGAAGPPQYQGFLDAAGCGVITGWAWDASQPNLAISVDVFDGVSFIDSVPANLFREDLVNGGIGNGFHGFSFTVPNSLKDGQQHSVRVRFPATAIELTNGPRTVSCSGGPPLYQGYHDGAGCNTIAGWAWDANDPNNPINVDIFDGATLIATVPAIQFRPDLVTAGIGNGFHGFSYTVPASLKDGQPHSIRVRFPGLTADLVNTPRTITCSGGPPVFQGFHDQATCSVISGWAWDRNDPNSPINVAIFADGQLIATVLAIQFRQDLVNAGVGNGYHAFSFNVPANLRNGQPHSIEVRFSGTSTNLGNTPRSINCTPP